MAFASPEVVISWSLWFPRWGVPVQNGNAGSLVTISKNFKTVTAEGGELVLGGALGRGRELRRAGWHAEGWTQV